MIVADQPANADVATRICYFKSTSYWTLLLCCCCCCSSSSSSSSSSPPPPPPPPPPLALQPTVGIGLSNNVLPFFSICHQLSPSSHSQHLKICFYFLFPSFPGSSPSSRPSQFLSEDLFGHPIHWTLLIIRNYYSRSFTILLMSRALQKYKTALSNY